MKTVIITITVLLAVLTGLMIAAWIILWIVVYAFQTYDQCKRYWYKRKGDFIYDGTKWVKKTES
jgi:hypothetical protein